MSDTTELAKKVIEEQHPYKGKLRAAKILGQQVRVSISLDLLKKLIEEAEAKG